MRPRLLIPKGQVISPTGGAGRPAPCPAPCRLPSGLTNRAWAFRKPAVLDPSQDFAQGQLFVYSAPFFPPPRPVSFAPASSPFPVICSTRGRGRAGGPSLSERPPSPSWAEAVTLGQAWEDGLRSRRHPARGERCAALLPAGGGSWPPPPPSRATDRGFACLFATSC